MKYSILEIAEILGADTSHLNNASIDTLLTDSRTLTYPDRSLFSRSTPTATTVTATCTSCMRKACAILWWSTSRKACRQATPISLL